jgi:hypothetical protein
MVWKGCMPDTTVQEFKKVKWRQTRETAVKDIENQRAYLSAVIPKNSNPESPEWQPYYQQRVLGLENESLNIAARLVWTNRSDKEGLIRRYLDILQNLIDGQDKETDLHVIESIMGVACSKEATRIRDAYPRFF